MAHKPLTFRDLMTGKAIPQQQKAVVDYVAATPDCSLPKLRFRWISTNLLADLSDSDMEKIQEKFPTEIEDAHHGSKSLNKLWVARVDKEGMLLWSQMYFCNFRRYGWAETSSPCGRTGYNNDVTYANQTDGGITTRTPEEVVRDTLIRAIAISRIPKHLKYCTAVRPLWDRLLKDALENISDFATHAVGSTNGYLHTKDIMVIGENVKIW